MPRYLLLVFPTIILHIRKIKAVAAEKVVVAPLEAIPPIDERYLADALESVPLIKGDNVMVPYFGGRLTFQVIGVTPAADAVLITQKTVFHIAEKGETLRGVPQVTYEDIGGIHNEIKKVREMIELPLRHPEIFEKLAVVLSKFAKVEFSLFLFSATKPLRFLETSLNSERVLFNFLI